MRHVTVNERLNVQQWSLYYYTGCVSEFGDFATLFFLVWQHWGGCIYHHFAVNFKVF
jgi:hypothetical protein